MSRGAPPNGHTVRLGQLMSVTALASAESVHLPDPGREVASVVLADSFDRLRGAAPHSIVVLHAAAATGGWSLAAALHLAWERNVACVVAQPDVAGTSTETLARKLDVALLLLAQDAVETALDLAAHVGAPAAIQSQRRARLAEALAEESSVRGILATLNRELRGVAVALMIGPDVVAGQRRAADGSSGQLRLSREIRRSDGRPWGTLVAAVPDPADAADVEVALWLASAPLLAAWARRLLEHEATTAQEQAAFHLLRRPEPSPAPVQELGGQQTVGAADLGWQLDGANRAVWITGYGGRHAPDLTRLLAHAWGSVTPGSPVVPDGDGWIAWRSGDRAGERPYVQRAVDRLAEVAGRHGLATGVGGVHTGVAGLLRSLDEARLAARAGTGPASPATWFEDLGLHAVLGSVPWAEVARVAELALPGLVEARDRAVLASTILALLDCGGSASAAADLLGVHRNTVLARTKRARDLGIDLDDPALRLPLHLACRSIVAIDPPM